jgi:hypothetical protein
MHFDERHSQLLPFCEYVFAPGKSPVEMQPEILDFSMLKKVYVVYMDLRVGFSSCGERDMDRRMVSSGLLSRVVLVRTDVSEEPGASFIRVTKIGC